MAQITVWKCDNTGKIFEDKDEYVRYLKRIARANLVQKNMKKDIKKYTDIISSSTTIEELEDNIKLIVKLDFKRHGVLEDPKFDFKFTEINYKDNIAATHCAPRGVKVNFNNPSHHKGFYCRVKYLYDSDILGEYCRVKYEYNHFSPINSLLKAARVNIGSGAGNLSHGTLINKYDCNLYMSDFPNLKCLTKAERRYRAEIRLNSLRVRHRKLEAMISDIII